MALAIGTALIAALVIRQSSSVDATRRLALVAGVAFALRLLAVTLIYLIAIQTHNEGNWLNDEASFYLATESLLSNPFDSALPLGLEHLGGDTFLGLTTAIALALGRMDTVAFRLLNATLGTLVAVMIAVVTAGVVSARWPAALAGILVAVWPTLILWSATFLRDTFASFVVVVVWWTLVEYRRVLNVRLLCVVALGLLMVAAIRPYLAGAMAVGLLSWSVYPILVSAPRRLVVASAAAVLMLGAGLVAQQRRHIDEAVHELVYRQMTTRMEALGLLYTDLPLDLPPQEWPFGSGAPVALVEEGSNWILPGLVQLPVGPGVVTVGFVDGSIRTERTADLTLLQSAPLSPVQIVASFGPGLQTFALGTSSGGEATSPAWIAEALGWDLLLALSIFGGIRAQVPLREWLFPACIVLGTVAALVAVPGAPGNQDRHRASQAVPLLAVFAAGWMASRRESRVSAGRAVRIATRSPMRP